MFSFRSHRKAYATASALLLVSLGAPHAGFSQDPFEHEAEDRYRQLAEQIEEQQTRGGFNSPQLVGLFQALGLFYQERGDHRSAIAIMERAREILRVNYGLNSLDQAALIRQLIYSMEATGNADAAWELEQELLALASRHPDDLRTARILRESADRRMNVLKRYSAGEFPPEIVLGCYYGWSRGSFQDRINQARGRSQSCDSGSRRHVKRRLQHEAQFYYAHSIGIVLRNESYESEEMPIHLTELAQSSYWYSNPGLGRRALRYLLAYEIEHSKGSQKPADVLVQIADWDLLHSDGRNQEELALAAYEQAYELFKENGIDRVLIERVFSPEIPVALPSFAANPLVSDEAAASTGYIDVAFNITQFGRSRNIRILESGGDSTRADENKLVRSIRQIRFRPRLTDGQFADLSPVIVRYQLNE